MKNSGGMSVGFVLLLIFVVLKLCGLIQWSWLWVLSPLWIPMAIAVIIGLLVSIFH